MIKTFSINKIKFFVIDFIDNKNIILKFVIIKFYKELKIA